LRAALVLVALSSVARAEPEPELAALAPSPADARMAVAIGPSGEVYEPDGHGAWTRKRAIEIALPAPDPKHSHGPVIAAARAGSRVLALTDAGVPFRLTADGWTVVHLGTKARPITSASPRPLAALGKTVFALDDASAEPVKLTDAPAPVLAAAASQSGVAIETERGLFRLEAKGWKPIAGAPPHVGALLSDRYALGDRGLHDLKTQKTLEWPHGAKIAFALAADDGVIAAAAQGKDLALFTVRAGKLASEIIPVDTPTAVVGLSADRAGRVVIALRDGRLVVRDKGKWSTAHVEDAPAAARPGSPPATSK
jgi:hypothetical protein